MSVVSFSVGATVRRADIPLLCARLAESLRGRDGAAGDLVVCDVADVAVPDAVTVEALARLRLTASRYGRRLVVGGAGADVRRLVRLFGLAEALPEASVEAGGQPEQREQAGGVEEVVDGRDLSA